MSKCVTASSQRGAKAAHGCDYRKHHHTCAADHTLGDALIALWSSELAHSVCSNKPSMTSSATATCSAPRGQEQPFSARGKPAGAYPPGTLQRTLPPLLRAQSLQQFGLSTTVQLARVEWRHASNGAITGSCSSASSSSNGPQTHTRNGRLLSLQNSFLTFFTNAIFGSPPHRPALKSTPQQLSENTHVSMSFALRHPNENARVYSFQPVRPFTKGCTTRNSSW